MHLSLIGSQTIIRTNGTHLFFTYRTFNTCETTMAIKAHTIVTSKVNSRPMDSACGVLQTVVHHIQLPALHEVLDKMHGVQDCVTYLPFTRPRGLESSGLNRQLRKGVLWGLINEVGGGEGLLPGRAYNRTKNTFQKKLHKQCSSTNFLNLPAFLSFKRATLGICQGLCSSDGAFVIKILPGCREFFVNEAQTSSTSLLKKDLASWSFVLKLKSGWGT